MTVYIQIFQIFIEIYLSSAGNEGRHRPCIFISQLSTFQVDFSVLRPSPLSNEITYLFGVHLNKLTVQSGRDAVLPLKASSATLLLEKFNTRTRCTCFPPSHSPTDTTPTRWAMYSSSAATRLADDYSFNSDRERETLQLQRDDDKCDTRVQCCPLSAYMCTGHYEPVWRYIVI